MALCIVIQATPMGGPPFAMSTPGNYTLLPWSLGDATYSSGNYECPTGSHLVMTIAEVNAMPKTGVPDAALMRESFFMSFGLVLGCYLLGKCVGAVLKLIKGGENDY